MLLSDLQTRDPHGIPRVFISALAEQYLDRFNVFVYYRDHQCGNAFAVIYVDLCSMRDQQLDDTSIAALQSADQRRSSPLIRYVVSCLSRDRHFRVAVSAVR